MDNQNTQNASGMMNGFPPAPQHDKKIGPIVGALVIILILIIAALYFFGQKLNTSNSAENSAPAVTEESGVNDDVDAIWTDLSGELDDVDYSF